MDYIILQQRNSVDLFEDISRQRVELVRLFHTGKDLQRVHLQRLDVDTINLDDRHLVAVN